MELALYGGAFNPPHNAHKKIIEYCYNRFDLVIVMPNGKSVNKKIDISKHHRLKMLEMVTKDYNERVVIDILKFIYQSALSPKCNIIAGIFN